MADESGSAPEPLQLVLVSSCLLGEPVRFDGGHCRCAHPVLARWLREGRVVPVCPEAAAGLATPRPPAEIAPGGTGPAVLAGATRVVDPAGQDLTGPFVRGARLALELARACGAQVAVLKDGSPSCGSAAVHDGRFAGVRMPGAGVTASLLAQAGLRVFHEGQLEEAGQYLAALDCGNGVARTGGNLEASPESPCSSRPSPAVPARSSPGA